MPRTVDTHGGGTPFRTSCSLVCTLFLIRRMLRWQFPLICVPPAGFKFSGRTRKAEAQEEDRRESTRAKIPRQVFGECLSWMNNEAGVPLLIWWVCREQGGGGGGGRKPGRFRRLVCEILRKDWGRSRKTGRKTQFWLERLLYMEWCNVSHQIGNLKEL